MLVFLLLKSLKTLNYLGWDLLTIRRPWSRDLAAVTAFKHNPWNWLKICWKCDSLLNELKCVSEEQWPAVLIINCIMIYANAGNGNKRKCEFQDEQTDKRVQRLVRSSLGLNRALSCCFSFILSLCLSSRESSTQRGPGSTRRRQLARMWRSTGWRWGT